MTGTSPVTLSDSAVLQAMCEETNLNMQNIRESTKAFVTNAVNHGDYMRKLRAIRLNKRGRVLKSL